jgi:hypothetical protein
MDRAQQIRGRSWSYSGSNEDCRAGVEGVRVWSVRLRRSACAAAAAISTTPAITQVTN